MTLSNTGGQLHGTWISNTPVTVSDKRLKTNVKELSRTIATRRAKEEGSNAAGRSLSEGAASEEGSFQWLLRQLRPVSYNFKAGSEAKNVRFGFVAQEIEKILPEVIREFPNKDGKVEDEEFKKTPKKGIVYPDLIAVFTGMLQEFNGELKALGSRVQAAETELDRLDEEDPIPDDIILP